VTAAVAPEPAAKTPRSYFRRPTVKLSPQAAARQGAVTQLAFLVMGRDAAIAFLNGPHADLAARPLDLAIESAEGAAQVETAIRALGRQPAGT
jgi:uncharacterized protein (DUF2384 family)